MFVTLTVLVRAFPRDLQVHRCHLAHHGREILPSWVVAVEEEDHVLLPMVVVVWGEVVLPSSPAGVGPLDPSVALARVDGRRMDWHAPGEESGVPREMVVSL